jgi:hypothetical protein
MKKTNLSEEAAFDFQSFLDTESFAAEPLAFAGNAALSIETSPKETFLPETILTAIKWTSLYFPGTAAIHFILMGFALSFFYGDWFVELFLGALGIFAVATFMIMFGIGKMLELKYLKVVLGILLTSTLAAILYSVLIVFIPGDFFGLFVKLTLALPVLTGYFVKKHLDSEEEN